MPPVEPQSSVLKFEKHRRGGRVVRVKRNQFCVGNREHELREGSIAVQSKLFALKPTLRPWPQSVGKFQQSAEKKGVTLSRKTQMLYRGKNIFINGESFAMNKADKATLETLANTRGLDGTAVAAASEDVLEALFAWYTDGWLELNK